MPEEPPSDFGNEHTENSIAKFQTLSAEGDLLLQRGAFQESLDVYTRALAIHPTDKHCLVSRSRCYIQIGLPTLALKDADASLREDPSYFKGQYQKAEALYAQSDFELALMYYHRGHRLRPELNEFRTGIQKAREAIDNSIGDAKNMRIYVPAKLRRNLAALAAAQPSMSDGGMGGSSPLASNAVGGAAVTGGKSQQQANGNSGNIIDTPKPYYLSGNLTPAMESKLLGELYEDKLFLQEMLNDHDSADYPDDQVRTLVNEGLHFLNTRAEFWRQQNPLYARKHEKPIRPIMEKKYMPKHPTHDAVQSETENRTRKIRYPPPTSQSQPSATSQPLPRVAQRKATA